MNVEIANSLSGYIESLYNLNKKLIKVCGIDCMSDDGDGEKEILDIIQEIPRIIPYCVKRGTSDLVFSDRDGLLEYSEEIEYLRSEYENILKENYSFLSKIKQIRNTYEHKMHGVKNEYTGSGTFLPFEFGFKIDGKEMRVASSEFIGVIKQVNILFSRLISDVAKFARQEKKDTYPYYKKITRFDFKDFNSIYDSELLRTIGKVMYEF